jgi:hypothetical protein
MTTPVANGRDAVQGAFQTSAVVGIDIPDMLHHEIQLLTGDLFLTQYDLMVYKTGSGDTPQVQDDFQ